MAFQGNLITISVTEVFSFLQQHRKSGTLCLVWEHQERSFEFLDGDLVSATARDPAKRLGGFLVRLGVITNDDIRRTMEEVASPAGHIGSILVEQEFISERELSAAVRAQMLELLEETLLWPSGAFYFDQNDTPHRLPSGPLIQTQSLLLEVSSKADERREVRQLFPDGNVIFARQDLDTEWNDLGPRETAILELVDGTHTVDLILFKSPHGLLNSALALQELIDREIIRQAGIRVQSEQERVTPDLVGLSISPDLAGRILRLYSHSTHSTTDLAELLAQDPLLMAKCLKALTSQGVELPRSIVRIDHVVDVLGDTRLHSLLVPEALRGIHFSPEGCLRQRCVDHSLLTGRLSEAIALHMKYPFPGEAYLAGLLHNLGVFVLLGRDPDRYAELARELSDSGRSLEDLEEEHLGVAHPKIGAVYAEKWNFPKLLVQTIKSHHNVGSKNANPLLHIVSVASTLAQESGTGIEPSIHGDERLDISLKQLDIDRRTVNGLLGELLSPASRRAPSPSVALESPIEAEQCSA